MIALAACALSPTTAVPALADPLPSPADQRRQGPASSAVSTGSSTSTARPLVNLRPGSKGARVKALQRALRLGGVRVGVDGVYGRATARAVRTLQRRIGLRPTGVATPAFQRRIGVPAPGTHRGSTSKAFFQTPNPDDPVTSAPPRPISGAPSDAGARALTAAIGQLGTPYAWSGESPGGFDCSGLLYWAFGQAGVDLPRVAADQARRGVPVERGELARGDAVFFGSSARNIHHIGIYVGRGRMVHAPRTGDVVSYDRIDTGYYARTYQGARRYS